MAKDKANYFPSLYDQHFGHSFDVPNSYLNIWKKPEVTSKDDILKGEASRWPPGLTDFSYIPTQVFSPPVQEDFGHQNTFCDKLCQLQMQMKEIELLKITGNWFNVQKYECLKTAREAMIRDMKAMHASTNPTQAAPRR